MNLLWSFIERFSHQIVQLLFSVLLARLILPEVFGIMAILNFIIAICNILVDSGFTQALIQKKNRDNLDYNTVFWFNMVVGLLIYTILWLFSRDISLFYKLPILSNLISIIGFILIFNSLGAVSKARILISFNFKRQTYITFTSVILSGLISYIYALKSPDIYALVLQSMLFYGFSNFLFFIYDFKWFNFSFSKKRFYSLGKYGYNLLLSSTLNVLFSNSVGLILAKYFTINELGFYSKSQQYGELPASNLSLVFNRVSFSKFSQFQGNKKILEDKFLELIKLSSIIIFPLVFIFSINSKSIILFVIGPNWLEASFLFQIFLIANSFYIINALNLSLLSSQGYSRLYLIIEIIKKIIFILCILFSYLFFKNLSGVCIGILVYNILVVPINQFYTNRIIKVSILRQNFVILKFLMIALISGWSYFLEFDFSPEVKFISYLTTYFLIHYRFKFININNLKQF